jgi:hypothetical protein
MDREFHEVSLVDPHSGLFLGNYAHQLFYGRQDETFPSVPDNFIRLYKTWESGSRDKAVESHQLPAFYRDQHPERGCSQSS